MRGNRVALALVALLMLVGHVDSARANHLGGMEAMSVDMNPSASPPNTATSLGSREPSARINENNILDADEDVVDGITIDVTATNIPASHPANGYQYTFNYGIPPAPGVCIVAHDANGLLLSGLGSFIVDASDPLPDCDGTWNSVVVDTYLGASESGSGFLGRLTLATQPGVIGGVYALSLTNAAHYRTTDEGTQVLPADSVNNATICINQSCDLLATDLKANTVATMSPGSESVDSTFDVFIGASLHNNGPATTAIADITVTLNLPIDCQIVSGSNVHVIQDSILIVSTTSNIPQQTFSVTCAEPGTHIVSGTVSVAEDDPTLVEHNLANNSATSPPSNKSIIGSSDIVVTKVDSTDPAAVGSNFQYTIQAKNNGPDPARGLVISDLLPNPADGDGRGNTTFVDVILGFDYDGDGIPDFTGAPCEPGFVGAQPHPIPPPSTSNSTLRCSITPTRTPSLPVNASVFVIVTVAEAATAGTANINLARASFENSFGEGSPSVDPDQTNEPDCAGFTSTQANLGCETTIAGIDTDGDGISDDLDADDDGDRVNDVDESACGGNALNASRRPERIDGAFGATDDDGDTEIDEPLPTGSSGFDCDGDGWKGNQEMLIFSAATTRTDQDPCGNGGWPADLDSDNKLNIGDVNSFTAPIGVHVDAHGNFNYFSHTTFDNFTWNVPRWNLDPSITTIDIGDINAINPGVTATTARPPMLGGQPAFFTNGGECPYAP